MPSFLGVVWIADLGSGCVHYWAGYITRSTLYGYHVVLFNVDVVKIVIVISFPSICSIPVSDR